MTRVRFFVLYLFIGHLEALAFLREGETVANWLVTIRVINNRLDMRR